MRLIVFLRPACIKVLLSQLCGILLPIIRYHAYKQDFVFRFDVFAASIAKVKRLVPNTPERFALRICLSSDKHSSAFDPLRRTHSHNMMEAAVLPNVFQGSDEVPCQASFPPVETKWVAAAAEEAKNRNADRMQLSILIGYINRRLSLRYYCTGTGMARCP